MRRSYFLGITTRLKQAGAMRFDCQQTRNPGLAWSRMVRQNIHCTSRAGCRLFAVHLIALPPNNDEIIPPERNSLIARRLINLGAKADTDYGVDLVLPSDDGNTKSALKATTRRYCRSERHTLTEFNGLRLPNRAANIDVG